MESLHCANYQAEFKNKQTRSSIKEEIHQPDIQNNYLNCPQFDIYHQSFPCKYVSSKIRRRTLFCNYPAWIMTWRGYFQGYFWVITSALSKFNLAWHFQCKETLVADQKNRIFNWRSPLWGPTCKASNAFSVIWKSSFQLHQLLRQSQDNKMFANLQTHSLPTEDSFFHDSHQGASISSGYNWPHTHTHTNVT